MAIFVFFADKNLTIQFTENDMANKLPQNVRQAVKQLSSELTLKEKYQIANTPEEDLIELTYTLGTHIRNEFGLWSGNHKLMKSCEAIAGRNELHEDEASSIIMVELWKKLRKNNLLRVVK
ncbi:DUF6794 domain-containing protein [Thermodesulfobacteriota bacterium]